MVKEKQELFQITQEDSGIAEQDAYPDLSTRREFIELFRYQVPIDRPITFKPGHTFSLKAYKLADQAVDGAVADDGGTETIEVVEANEATTDDMQLKPAVPVANDAYYFGYRFPFSGLTVKYSTAATTGVTIWEYWNGSAWVALSGVTDGTAYWITAAGTHDITWTMPRDWAAGGSGNVGTTPPTLFWVRCRVTTAGDVATGDQAWIHPDPTEMGNTDLVRVEVRDENELTKKVLINGALYSQVKEFQDRDKLYRLDINEEVRADGDDWLVILVRAFSPIDASPSYFALTCDRRRHAII